MHISALVATLLSFFVLVSTSQSQDLTPPASDATERARQHFERGVEHYSAGNYDAALAEFQRTHELRPSYKLLFNLAQVQVERRDNAAALQLFSEYLRLGGSEVPPERVSEVEQETQRLRQSVAELRFVVDVPGARIFVNAAPVGVSPMSEPVLVNAGSALIRVEKAGHNAFVETVNIAGSDRRQLDVTLEPLSAAPREPLAVPSQRPREVTPNMTPFWISLGAAVVLGGATATFGALSLNAYSEQQQLLATYPGRPSELQAASNQLQTYAALTDIFAGATAVAGIVGLYFAFAPPERQEPPPTSQATLKLSATPTSIALSGAF